MKSSAIGLSFFSLLLATIPLARAATRFEPLRLVSAVDPTVAPWATPNGDSFGMQLAPDGRLVTFESDARNLVPGVDTNYSSDVFVRDLTTGTTRLVSVNLHGTEPGLGGSVDPVITPLWRYEIASGEGTLITTNLTSSTSMEQTIYTMSPDGRWVAFLTAPETDHNDIELWDGDTGNTILATPAVDGITGANGFCDMPELSADGRFLVFTSSADNLVTNTFADDGDVNVFIRDLVHGHTTLITSDATGTALGGSDLAFPAISPDGKWVSFDSYHGGFLADDRNVASDVFLHDRDTGAIEMATDESDHVRLHWAVAPGRTYVVESTLDLVAGEWTATPGVVRMAGALAQFQAAEPRDAPAHYYRLRITCNRSESGRG